MRIKRFLYLLFVISSFCAAITYADDNIIQNEMRLFERNFKHRPGPVKVRIELRGSLSRTYNPDWSGGLSAPLMYAYREISQSHIKGCFPLEEGRTYEDCLAQKMPGALQTMREDFSKMSDEDLAAKLKLMFNGRFSFTEKDAQVFRAYDDLLQLKTTKEVLGYLKERSDDLSTEQKVLLVQTMGAHYEQFYDQKRFKWALLGRGKVTITDLQKNLSRNLEAGDWNLGVVNQFRGDYAGVCRDLASAQGQMLQALGFRNTYNIMAFTADGYHVITMSQDPRSNKLYYFDYGEVSSPNAGDSRSLSLGAPKDNSLSYRVFKPGGRSLANIPSDLGKFLYESSGGDIQTIDALGRFHGSSLYVSGRVNEKFQIRGGMGASAAGDNIYSIGFSSDWRPETRTPGSGAVMVGNRQYKEVSWDFLYTRVDQMFRSKLFEVTPDLALRLETTASLLFAVNRLRESGQYEYKDGNFVFQPTLFAKTGIKAYQKEWSEKFLAQYFLGVQIVPGIRDVRNAAINQALIPVVNQLLFTSDGRLKLAQTAAGQAYLVAATTILMDQLGAHGIGLKGRTLAGTEFVGKDEKHRIGTVLQVEGRLTDDTALFTDGAFRRLRSQTYWEPNSVIRIAITATKPLEPDPFGEELYGNIILKY